MLAVACRAARTFPPKKAITMRAATQKELALKVWPALQEKHLSWMLCGGMPTEHAAVQNGLAPFVRDTKDVKDVQVHCTVQRSLPIPLPVQSSWWGVATIQHTAAVPRVPILAGTRALWLSHH